MTGEERADLAYKLGQYDAYVHAVRTHGPGHFVAAQRPGFGARTWDGSYLPEAFKRRRHAEDIVRGIAHDCASKAREIRAQLTAAEMDTDQAATTPEEQQASARAYESALFPRFRRTA